MLTIESLTSELGLEVRLLAAVRDSIEEVAEFLRTEMGRHGVVIVTGGLGGTPDDLTREAVAGAFGVTRLMTSMLFEVSTTDPITFAGIPVLLGLVALVACYVPARRAVRVNPMTTLAEE